ncbi:MAG: helix-turn-helix transcriptional regulator [Gammaproteobacteria bacterium]|jgi:excisionase family DNA binding protein
MAHAPDYLTTAEVAAYLRLKERKVYDLVRQGEMPCVRITGKLLFPRQAIDLWLMNHLEGDERGSVPVPPVLAGSHDPLLDWAARESGAALAFLCRGSMDGARRLLEGRAMLAGMHVLAPETGEYNQPHLLGLGGLRDLVVVHWATRRQGLLLEPGNPHGIHVLADIARPGLRVAHRQPDAGADTLFRWLLGQAGVNQDALALLPHPALTEDDLALEIREGHADAGLAIEASARRHGLDFIPLHHEQFQLALRRRHYFEPPIQRLLEFARGPRLQQRAEEMGGYDVSRLGAVAYNA